MKQDAPLRLMARLLRQNWAIIAGIVVLTLFSSVGQVIIGYLLQRTVDIVSKGDHSAFASVTLRFVGLAVALPVIDFANGQLCSLGSQGAARKLRDEVSQAFLRSSDLGGQRRLTSGETVSRVMGDCWRVANAPMNVLRDMCNVAFSAVLAFIYIIHFSPLLALVAVVVNPIPVVWGALWVRQVARAERAHSLANDHATTAVADAHTGLVEYKTQAMEAAAQRLLADRYAASYSTSRRFDILSGYNNSGNELIGLVTQVGTYLIAGYLVLDGQITIGFMLAFLVLMQHVQRPFQSATQILRQVASSLVAASRVNDLLSLPQEGSGGHPIPAQWDKLELENVTFSYQREAEPIAYPPIAISAGECVGLVGANGAGKTTLLCLVLRLLTPRGGSVSVNDAACAELDLASYRSAFAVAPQEPHFLEGSVRANLDPHKKWTDGELWDALEKTGLSSAVRAKGGLDCHLGPGGTNLSRGQRQRLALARLFLRPEAKVLILDEPFASLDSDDRDQLMSALHELIQDRMTVIVSHRSEDLAFARRTVRLRAMGEVPSGE